MKKITILKVKELLKVKGGDSTPIDDSNCIVKNDLKLNDLSVEIKLK